MSRAPAIIWRPAYLSSLAKNGNKALSAKDAGVTMSAVRMARNRSKDFRAQETEALEQAKGLLEGEAYRRAVLGVNEPVFYQGKQAVDDDGRPITVKKYSDQLLATLLRAADPDKYPGESRLIPLRR